MGLILENVEVHRHRFQLGPINLALPDRAWVSIVGESGSGKSTLLGAVSGLAHVVRGAIRVDDQDIASWPIEKRPCTACQQDPLLFPIYTVAENLAFPLRAHGASWREAINEVNRRALALRVPARILRSRADKISGGEARRAALARAFLRPFRIALLDEISNGLDEETQRDVLEMVSQTHRATEAMFLFVSHDPILALVMSTTATDGNARGFVLVMKDGVVAQFDDPVTVYERPNSLYVARLFGAVSVLRGERQPHQLTANGASLGLESDLGTVAVRAEHVRFATTSSEARGVLASVTSVAYTGAQVRLNVRTPFGDILAYSTDTKITVGSEGAVFFERLLYFAQ